MPRRGRPRGGRRASTSRSNIINPRPYPRLDPNSPRVEIKDDEAEENGRYVASFLNQRSVKSLYRFPPEILESDGKLYALFKVWKDENQLYIPPGREDKRRFEAFKESVIDVHNSNCKQPSGGSLCLNEFAVYLPSDPWEGCHVTEEEGERLRPLLASLKWFDDDDDDDYEHEY